MKNVKQCKIFGQPIEVPGPRQNSRIEYGLFSFELDSNDGEAYIATARLRGSKHIVAISDYKKASEALSEVEEKVKQILQEQKEMIGSPLGRLLSNVSS
jgi:hypothetical protein